MSNLFNKLINERQFNFQPFDIGANPGYHVNVKDEEGTRWEFRMLKETGTWKMEAEKLPPWILDLNEELCQAIDEHE